MKNVIIESKDIVAANRLNCPPTYTSIARCLGVDWRQVAIIKGSIQIFVNKRPDKIYIQEDKELIRQIHKEWKSNRSYFTSKDYEPIEFGIIG